MLKNYKNVCVYKAGRLQTFAFKIEYVLNCNVPPKNNPSAFSVIM